MLIGFVMASQIFGFTALSIGLLSSDKAKETIQAGPADTRCSTEAKSPIIPTASSTGISGATVSDNAAAGESIGLIIGKALIKYTDVVQSKMFVSTTGFTATAPGDADTNKPLERNEAYEIQLKDLRTTPVGQDTIISLN